MKTYLFLVTLFMQLAAAPRAIAGAGTSRHRLLEASPVPGQIAMPPVNTRPMKRDEEARVRSELDCPICFDRLKEHPQKIDNCHERHYTCAKCSREIYLRSVAAKTTPKCPICRRNFHASVQRYHEQLAPGQQAMGGNGAAPHGPRAAPHGCLQCARRSCGCVTGACVGFGCTTACGVITGVIVAGCLTACKDADFNANDYDCNCNDTDCTCCTDCCDGCQNCCKGCCNWFEAFNCDCGTGDTTAEFRRLEVEHGNWKYIPCNLCIQDHNGEYVSSGSAFVDGYRCGLTGGCCLAIPATCAILSKILAGSAAVGAIN